MSGFALEEQQVLKEGGKLWWLFLFTGLLWFLFAIIVFRFDYTSVSAVSILFGIVAIVAGVNEFLVLGLVQRWWKVLHAGLGVLFVIVGIVAFVHPGNTFDVIVAIATHNEVSVWWLQLVIGIVELVLGFWAAAYFGRSAILLVAWVGAIALMRGITEIIFAFKLRSAARGA